MCNPLLCRAEELTLESLSRRLSGVRTLTADFTQNRRLRAAARPLVSRGRVAVVQGAGVLWDQASPFVTRTTVTRQKITIELEGGRTEVVTSKSNPRAFAFASLMQSVLSGDASAFKSQFDVKNLKERPGGRWELSLAARAEPLSRMFSLVRISGREAVESLELRSAAKEVTRIDFRSLVLNEAPDETVRRRLGL
ncbi:outer membrane lipoprotein carrier protein LolA [Mesosutterella sp. OilRF-GAM-744-9]|uniref:Outer membrane lipoprotein carrier protein LolA n=1 Tax=Mesosutterella porci TaxID=2915351 RepID=A0ABS9MRM5_9BURK|nr:outer membrane lipoprotein carrier protein LolA [Mesosutterella sp. oilRF-744-WT-GAM-9]MCG5031027.1 outer membrane lipoprotein carrier protein LolA [Mesosutterella sp. oilRF-744-WT-GAM-9]